MRASVRERLRHSFDRRARHQRLEREHAMETRLDRVDHAQGCQRRPPQLEEVFFDTKRSRAEQFFPHAGDFRLESRAWGESRPRARRADRRRSEMTLRHDAAAILKTTDSIPTVKTRRAAMFDLV